MLDLEHILDISNDFTAQDQFRESSSKTIEHTSNVRLENIQKNKNYRFRVLSLKKK